MGASQDTTPKRSEKDLLHTHYKKQDQQDQQEQQRAHNHDLPPTPTSISPIGSPILPLTSNSAASTSILSGSLSKTNTNENHVPQTPPPYSGPVSSNRTPTQPPPTSFSASGPPQKYPGLPALHYHLYCPPLFELSPDRTTLKSTASYLSSSAAALISLLRAQATVPPKPQIHIIGRRSGPHGRHDFALKLNLLPLLVPDDPARRMDYLRSVGASEPARRGGPSSAKPALTPHFDSVEAWARRFVEDDSAVKAFVLERVVVNADLAWLEGQVRMLVAAMGYEGAVSVTFPVTHARVVVQSPDRVNKFFTGLTALVAGRRTYEVVQAVWPFASCRRAEPGERVCAVQSEEQWWREWAGPIRFAIAERRNGWVTSEDKLEAIMEGKGKGLAKAKVDWSSGGEQWSEE